MLMIQNMFITKGSTKNIVWYSCENSIALLTHIQRSIASRAILPFVKQWIVFTTCNINNYYNTPFKEIDVINWLPTSKSFKIIYLKKTMSQI
jgi:hypothetical protein